MIQAILFQFFETTYLISNSNAPDTVIGRSLLLQRLFQQIILIRNEDEFENILLESINNYKESYNERNIDNEQYYIVANADLKYVIDYIFFNIERSYFYYINSQFVQINKTRKESSKISKLSKLQSFITNQSSILMTLVNKINNKIEANIFFEKHTELRNILWNYINMKLDGFDEEVCVIIFNNTEHNHEENMPINDLVKHNIKKLKAKLYYAQFLLRNEPVKVCLNVTENQTIRLNIENASNKLTQEVNKIFNV